MNHTTCRPARRFNPARLKNFESKEKPKHYAYMMIFSNYISLTMNIFYIYYINKIRTCSCCLWKVLKSSLPWICVCVWMLSPVCAHVSVRPQQASLMSSGHTETLVTPHVRTPLMNHKANEKMDLLPKKTTFLLLAGRFRKPGNRSARLLTSSVWRLEYLF